MSNTNTITRRLILTDQGFEVEEITRRCIGSQHEVLGRAVEQVPLYLPNVAQSPAPEMTGPLHLWTRGPSWCLWTRLKILRINTQWRPIDGKMVPVFRSSSETLKMSPDWPIPATMKVFFLVTGDTPRRQDSREYQLQHVYLIATHSEGGSFRLPLPNTYDNGRLCMGDAFNPYRNAPRSEATLTGLFKYTLQEFLESEWNTDLMNTETVSNARELFAMDMDSKHALLDPVADWRRWCRRVSAQAYAQLPLT